jgi:hypothetical protein
MLRIQIFELMRKKIPAIVVPKVTSNVMLLEIVQKKSSSVVAYSVSQNFHSN